MTERPDITALRARIAALAAEGRENEREAAAWLLADVLMRGAAGFDQFRRSQQVQRRFRYPIIEAK